MSGVCIQGEFLTDFGILWMLGMYCKAPVGGGLNSVCQDFATERRH